MKNDQWLRDILGNLNYWQGRPLVRFHYNPLYRVGVGKKSKLDFIFGNKRKAPLKNLRKFRYFSIEAPFPEDSIIFFQPTRERLIIASPSEGKVFKISTSSFQLALRDNEISLLKHLEKSEFAPHSAKLLEVGPNWIVTSFCSNEDSLLNLPDLDLTLMKTMDPLIMDPMAKFYKAYSPERVKLSDWLDKAVIRSEGHPEHEKLLRVISHLRSENKNDEVLRGQLHLDLHAGNILKAGEQVVVIDFEVTHPGLILIDYFDFYRRYLNKTKKEQKSFFTFLARKGKPSAELQAFYSKYQQWLKQFSVEATELDMVFKIYALERVLIYWDKWKDNRLKDKKGLEFKVINLVLSNFAHKL